MTDPATTADPAPSIYLWACPQCNICISTYHDLHINDRPICVICNFEMSPVDKVPATPSQPAAAREWQTKLEQAFYKLGIAHFASCEINQTDFCTCGASADRQAFKNLMSKFIADYNVLAAKDEEAA